MKYLIFTKVFDATATQQDTMKVFIYNTQLCGPQFQSLKLIPGHRSAYSNQHWNYLDIDFRLGDVPTLTTATMEIELPTHDELDTRFSTCLGSGADFIDCDFPLIDPGFD